MLLLLTGRSMRELWMFFGWFTLENPDLLLPSPMKDAVLAGLDTPPARHRPSNVRPPPGSWYHAGT